MMMSTRVRTTVTISVGILLLSACGEDGGEEAADAPEAVEAPEAAEGVSDDEEADDGVAETPDDAGDDEVGEQVDLAGDAELLLDGEEVPVTDLECSDLGQRLAFVHFDYPGSDEVTGASDIVVMVSDGEDGDDPGVDLTLPLRDGETPAEDRHDYLQRRARDVGTVEFTEDRARGEATVETYHRSADADPVLVEFDFEVPTDESHPAPC